MGKTDRKTPLFAIFTIFLGMPGIFGSRKLDSKCLLHKNFEKNDDLEICKILISPLMRKESTKK
jgi:hypothetical protein